MKPATTATERKSLLLKHADVTAWVNDRSAGSGSVQLDHLRVFLERTDIDVDGLVRLAKRDERKFKATVLGFVKDRQGAGLSAKYVGNIWWSVRSFLRSVNAAPEWNPTVRETAADEEDEARIVPSHAQVSEIASATKSARDRMVVMVLASSGVRIGTFGNQNGHADGLRLKHLIDLRLEPEPHFERTPPMLRIPSHLAKSNEAYYTGITPAAAEAVLVYLKERTKKGEKLVPESPLVVPDGRGVRESRKTADGFEVVMRKSLASRVQAAIDTVFPGKNRPTPHALRAFFSTELETAEARGAISRSRRFFFTAHRLGGVDEGYNLSRPLPPSKVEELREDFRRVLPFLELDQRERKGIETKAEIVAALTRAIAQATGKQTDGSLRGDDLLAALHEALRGASPEAESAPEPSSVPSVAPAAFPAPKRAGEQRSVDAEAVGQYLEAGWSFVSPLNSHLAVVKWDGPGQ